METFRRFEARGSDPLSRDISALASEPDAELYFEGLHRLAGRMARRDQSAEAAELWSFVAEEAATASPSVARRAREELEVLSGGGNFGRRVEFLSQRFFSEATSPTALIGMTVAGGVYSLGRNVLLGRLLAAPAGLFTRGLGARAVAGLGAFAVEAPAFTLSTRALHSASGQASPNSLGHDLLASYLTLGGLKLFASVGSLAVQRAGAGSISQALIPTASAYLGILAGHGLERAFHLRPERATDQVLLDSLAMLLQFQVGGRLAADAMGPRWAAWQHQMNLRSEGALRLPELRIPGGNPLAENFAMAGGVPSSRAWEAPLRNNVLMMVAKRPGSEYNDPYNSPPIPIPGDRPSGTRISADVGVMEHLNQLRQAQETLRDRGEELTLLQILNRGIIQDRIPEGRREELTRAVQSAKLFENSPILNRQIREADLATPESLANRLNELRVELQVEQGEGHYALATLVQALVYGGRVPYERLRSLLTASASFDFYREHPILGRMPAKNFSDPYTLVNALRPVRRRIESAAERRYKLSTLIDALQWHPSFPRSLHQTYSMVGGASDFVGALSRRRLRIEIPQLRELDPEQIFLRLLHLKPALRGADGEPVSIGYMLMGLHSHGLDRVRNGRINESAIQSAYAIDMALERWNEWGGHYRNLSLIPKHREGVGELAGWRRPGYARVHLLKENGEPYSDSRLSTIARWGTFLWEHREALSLPTPQPVSFASLLPSRGPALHDFLMPYWERLREKTPEDFMRSMLEIRQKYRETQAELRQAAADGEAPSVLSMIAAFYKTHGAEIPGSIRTYAHQVDAILRRWNEWSEHFRRIATLPTRRSQGYSRIEYASENLKRENGESFSRDSLNNIVRWGVWIWENRGDIQFPKGSIPPPPPAAE